MDEQFGQQHERFKEKSKEKQSVQFQQKEKVLSVCLNCGNKNESSALFCEECGNSLNANTCKNCNAELIPGADVCEECGHNLILVKCSFCGSDKDETDQFCPECGSPANGIQCKTCNTLNFGNFCTSCNRPLTDMALEELERAKSDPEYIEVVQLLDDMEQLQKEMELEAQTFDQELLKEQQQEVESRNVQDSLNKDRELFNSLNSFLSKGKQEIEKKQERKVVKKPEPPRKTYDKSSREKLLKKREEQMQQIEAKREELQQKLNEMAGKQFQTPQQARTYFDARKPPIENLVWKCNFNKSLHPDPDNCGQPQHGGQWIIRHREIKWRTHHGNM